MLVLLHLPEWVVFLRFSKKAAKKTEKIIYYKCPLFLLSADNYLKHPKEGNVNMSKSDREPVIMGILREYALDVLSPVLFSLLLVAFFFVVPDIRMLFLVLFPLGTISATIIIVLRRNFLLGPTGKGQKTGSIKNRLPHFTALLHLHHYDDTFPTREETEEFEVVLGAGDSAARQSAEMPGLVDSEETMFVATVDGPLDDGVNGVVVIEGDGDENRTSSEDPEEDEEVVTKDDNYIDTSTGIPPSRLPQLKLKNNEINAMRKSILLPPLKSQKKTPTPWSSTIQTMFIGDDEEGEDAEEGDVVEAELFFPESEVLSEAFQCELPDEDSTGTEVAEGTVGLEETEETVGVRGTPAMELRRSLNALGINDELVDALGTGTFGLAEEETAAKRCGCLTEETSGIIEQPADYLGNWLSLSVKTKDYTISEDSSYLHNQNYSLYKCTCCRTSFTSLKSHPLCPKCGAKECSRV